MKTQNRIMHDTLQCGQAVMLNQIKECCDVPDPPCDIIVESLLLSYRDNEGLRRETTFGIKAILSALAIFPILLLVRFFF